MTAQTADEAAADAFKALRAKAGVEHGGNLIAGVVDFVDPLLADEDGVLSHWDYEQMRWI